MSKKIINNKNFITISNLEIKTCLYLKFNNNFDKKFEIK